jgi:hypothetical protein
VTKRDAQNYSQSGNPTCAALKELVARAVCRAFSFLCVPARYARRVIGRQDILLAIFDPAPQLICQLLGLGRKLPALPKTNNAIVCLRAGERRFLCTHEKRKTRSVGGGA